MKERYEQEIEQLLSELEAESPSPANTPPPNDPVRPLDDEPSPYAPRPRAGVRLISPGKLAVAGLILAVVGLLMPLLKMDLDGRTGHPGRRGGVDDCPANGFAATRILARPAR